MLLWRDFDTPLVFSARSAYYRFLFANAIFPDFLYWFQSFKFRFWYATIRHHKIFVILFLSFVSCCLKVFISVHKLDVDYSKSLFSSVHKPEVDYFKSLFQTHFDVPLKMFRWSRYVLSHALFRAILRLDCVCCLVSSVSVEFMLDIVSDWCDFHKFEFPRLKFGHRKLKLSSRLL